VKPYCALALLPLLLGSLPAAASEILFDQTPANITNGVFTSSGTYPFDAAAADDFEIAAPFALERVIFWAFEEVGSSWDGTLSYAIWEDSGLVAPETTAIANATVSASAFDKTLESTGVVFGGATYNQYRYEFDVMPISGLQANQRYWLSIYLGTPTGLTNSNGFLWQQTSISVLASDGTPDVLRNAAAAPPATADWLALSGSNLAFQLEGRTPIPGTAVLMLPLLGIAALLRRRAGKARA
jgi:hypothetical protein